MTITKKSCKNFSEIQKQNRNDIGGSLAGFSSHNYSPAGNTPSHQLNTTLSVAKNTNTKPNTNNTNTNTKPNTNNTNNTNKIQNQTQITQITQIQIQNTKHKIQIPPICLTKHCLLLKIQIDKKTQIKTNIEIQIQLCTICTEDHHMW